MLVIIFFEPFSIEILCQPLMGRNVIAPFVPVRCKGFDRAPGTSRFTFTTLFTRDKGPLRWRSVRNVARFIHCTVCLTIERAFSFILHHGFNSSSTGMFRCNRVSEIGWGHYFHPNAEPALSARKLLYELLLLSFIDMAWSFVGRWERGGWYCRLCAWQDVCVLQRIK